MRKRLLLTSLSLLSFFLLFAQTRSFTGKVVGPDNLPVPSATVTISGLAHPTLTNADGTFKIQLPEGGHTITVSSVGFATKSLSINASDKAIIIKLDVQVGALSDVVVTSLGISSEKKALGYATTTIKSEQLIEAGATNFAAALYGKAPGVQIAASPGGATSGVVIQIRGVNSINFKTTPLIILDGVPIHDGQFDNSNYWNDQRIRGNGLLDLNNEDIENISILKGASAAALYGSEATNGVMIITTKSGKNKKGFSLDASINYFEDKVSYLPQYQNVRGMGDINYGGYNGLPGGFGSIIVNGQTVRTLAAVSRNFGPKFDGLPVMSWDGTIRPYSFQKNAYADLFQTGHNYSENIAFTNSSENSSSRFSYTHQHTEGLSIGSRNEKNVFNLNSTYRFGKYFSTDVLVNFINQDIHNRPYMVDRLMNNFTGMMGTFDNGGWYMNKYQTSLGYKYVTGSNLSLTPAENLIYSGYKTDILDYAWNVNKHNSEEISNRLISSITGNLQILKNLKLRGRISTDLTSSTETDKNYTEVPIALTGQYTGYYGVISNTYNILYGDLLLTYNTKINKSFDLMAMAGYTGDKENSNSSTVGTNGGLTTENRFDLSSSYLSPYYSTGTRTSLVKDALLGTINLNYKNYWYVQGTIRRDRTSSMNPNNNSFVYPSINSGFVLSDAFKLPKIIDYAKLRASYGIVGNYPPPYVANIAYTPNNYGQQGIGGSLLTTTYNNTPYGNSDIKPEKKKEYEFGLEAKLFHNLLNLDMAYYHATIVDQILNLTLPQSSGAGSVLANIGTLKNEGFEIGLSGTPVQKKAFRWETGINFSTNKNTVVKLANGSSQLLHADYDGQAAELISYVGHPMGDLISHPEVVDAKGNKVVGSDGLYLIDSKWQKYGNVMPKGVGGFFNSFKYKGLSLDVNIDFRLGGDVMPTGLNWLTSRGADKKSLGGMDKAHGGLTYYLDANGVGYQTTASSGPNGEKVHDDGILLPGVSQTGQTNTNVVPSEYYWNNVYNWGGPQYSESLYHLYIQKNTYIKAREITLSYVFSSKIASKLAAKKLQLSVFGRNLFYIYRTIKSMDAEQLTAGSNWTQNVNNAGNNPSSRTYGVMLRASF